MFFVFQNSKSELQLHRNSHQFLENQSLVLSGHYHGQNKHHKSESKLLDTQSDYHLLGHNDTNTEVSLVTGVEYGGGPEPDVNNPQSSTNVNNPQASTVLKGVLWQQRDKVFSRWKERYFVLTADYLQCFKKSSPSVMHSAASEMGRFIFKLKLTEVISNFCFFVQSVSTRLKKFSPRPRGKSVIGKIWFEYIIQKFLLKKNSLC